MEPLLPTARHLARTALLLAAAHCAGQSTCYDFGSIPTPASWEASPSLLGCSAAPDWPAWHLFTPAHRAPAPHPGFNPGDATARPRLLVTYRCTGLLLLPVVPMSVRFQGYVVDQTEVACLTP